jgi:hypothetical protein
MQGLHGERRGKPYAGNPHVRFDEGLLARACLHGGPGSTQLRSGEPSRQRDSEGDKNALEANGLAMSLPEVGKINVGHDSPAGPGSPTRGLCAVGWGCAYLQRRIAGSLLLNTSELRCD